MNLAPYTIQITPETKEALMRIAGRENIKAATLGRLILQSGIEYLKTRPVVGLRVDREGSPDEREEENEELV